MLVTALILVSGISFLAGEVPVVGAPDSESQALEKHLDRVTIGPKGELMGPREDIAVLVVSAKNYVEPSWEKFRKLSPDEQSKMVLAALQTAHHRSYLETISLVVEGVADGMVSPAIGSDAIWMSGDDGVLAMNSEYPRFKAVLPRLLPRYAANSNEASYIRMLISGKARENYLDYCWNNSLTPIQSIDGRYYPRRWKPREVMFMAGGAAVSLAAIFIGYLVWRARRLRV